MLMCAPLHARLEHRFHISGSVLLARDCPERTDYRNAVAA
jgi:hypothetical protein